MSKLGEQFNRFYRVVECHKYVRKFKSCVFAVADEPVSTVSDDREVIDQIF